MVQAHDVGSSALERVSGPRSSWGMYWAYIWRKEGGPTHVPLCPTSRSWNEEGPEALSSQPELGIGVGVRDGHSSSYLPCQAQEVGELLPFPRKSVPSPCAPASCNLEMQEETGKAGIGLRALQLPTQTRGPHGLRDPPK